jgi:transcriptional antiterminator NusG
MIGFECRRVRGQGPALLLPIIRIPEVAMPSDIASFTPGDHVRVVDGPFSNFIGVVDAVDAVAGELSVQVHAIGRLVPIRTEAWQVEPLSPTG